jgi:hypothetical protein
MAKQKVFGLPDGFTPPQIDFRNVAKWQEDEKNFIANLATWCKGRNPHEDQNYIGEVIDFPVADGKALYMIAALRPLQLIHLPLGDAWSFQQEHLLTAKEVKTMVDRRKKFDEIWKKQKAEKGQ